MPTDTQVFPRAVLFYCWKVTDAGQDDVRDKTYFVTTKDIRERDRVMVDKLCGLRTDLTIFRRMFAKMIIHDYVKIQII